MGQVSCPHYPPSILAYPTFICPGCASLVADARHPQNQANGMVKATLLADPSSRTWPRPLSREG
jgi:hypothetical protein